MIHVYHRIILKRYRGTQIRDTGLTSTSLFWFLWMQNSTDAKASLDSGPVESRKWDSCIIVNLLRTIRWVPILKKLYFVYAKYDPPVLHCLAVNKQRPTLVFFSSFSFDLRKLSNSSWTNLAKSPKYPTPWTICEKKQTP